jgi:acyl-CoA synthetase (AMP-forming)/AMP-acid ligase II
MPNERSGDARPPIPFSCLPHLLEYQARRIPDAPAILAPGRAPLTYRRLYQQIEKVGDVLRAMGIGSRDRVALVLPNGPELPVAIFAVAACAACAPVNPALGVEELDRYFADLQPRALITQAGTDSPARRAALSRGIGVIELSTASEAEAGLFELTRERGNAQSHEEIGSSNVALLLPTSGTTSRPKIVPQTHANICESAYASAAALALTEADRCLNVLPLFHGHGLTATVLTSLAAGASVVCTSGLDVINFSARLTAFRPTWYSAVPTMHQTILAHARHNRDRLADSRLRFVRSSSAALSPRSFTELEQAFDAPVIEFYGMTETASSPIACNPLPPRQRKAGSVGVVVGLDVAILNEGDTPAPDGQIGQVAVRGASVTSGYDGDPIAREAAFVGDWFKTGDQGFFDGDGYLFLVGRIREMINRGGEKVAPQEVDDVLVEHPAVAEAATFAVPHTTLGEDVASAVVLREGCIATPKDIRQFAIDRIADFKVPRQVLIVTDLPKGPTGKVKRVDLAAKLGFASEVARPPTFVAPRTPVEKMLARLWADVLEVEQVGIHDDFFVLGGDSLLASVLLARVYGEMQTEIEVSCFVERPTVAEMARHVAGLIKAAGQAHQRSSAIVPADRQAGVPASIRQEWLWRAQLALMGIPVFNVLYMLRLTTQFDLKVLERCINEIARRHEILRTTFAIVDGRLLQVIGSESTVALTFDDLQSLPESRRETIGCQLLQDELRHSFDLAQGPLFRVRLLRLAEREQLFVFSTHQVISDGWSLGVLVSELTALYDAFSRGAESPLAPLPLQFADFASWQRRWQSHADIVVQLAYWKRQLCDPLPVLQFANARPKGIIHRFQTARRAWALPAGLSRAAKDFSHREGSTLFMTLVAALKTLLHRYFGEDDLRVATMAANRNHPGTEALIGPLAHPVILRTSLGGDPSPQEVLRRVRATTLTAYANQDLPFEALVETLERERDLKPAALSQVMILLQNAALRPTASSGDRLSFEEADPGMLLPLVTITTFDVMLMLHQGGYGLRGTCVYKPHLFSARKIDRLLRDFHEVLDQMVAQPERPISAIRLSRNRGRSRPAARSAAVC